MWECGNVGLNSSIPALPHSASPSLQCSTLPHSHTSHSHTPALTHSHISQSRPTFHNRDRYTRSMGGPRLDRYAAENEDSVPAVDPHNGLGARSAPRRQQELAKGFRGTGYQGQSHWLVLAVALTVAVSGVVEAQTTKRRAPAKNSAPPAPALNRVQAEIQCPSELGVGVKTRRRYCDVLTGRDPKSGILVTIPSHRGPVTLSFELHNRHMYSDELIKAKKAFRQYTATIGVLTMDNTLVDRAVIQSDFRAPSDLYDRIEGGAAPGGVKAVAPTGAEFITMELPDEVGDQVSILGESLKVKRPDGDDNFVAPGRPIATISNVMIEYRSAPPPKKRP